MATLLAVLVATMPYSTIVVAAYAPLAIGILAIAAFARKAKARRRHH